MGHWCLLEKVTKLFFFLHGKIMAFSLKITLGVAFGFFPSPGKFKGEFIQGREEHASPPEGNLQLPGSTSGFWELALPAMTAVISHFLAEQFGWEAGR